MQEALLLDSRALHSVVFDRSGRPGNERESSTALAYAITIHKSQGSEFPAVVIPLATQHYMLLQRNLVYTGITRGKRLLVLIGQRKALGIAVHNDRPQRRYSGLLTSLRRDR
jgi:exodeoxyribonuclease V alpha subunit